jgi:hypothetical protein
VTERTVTVHLNAAVTRYMRNMRRAEEQTADVRAELRGLREEAQHLTFGGITTALAGLPGLLSPIGAGLTALPGLAMGAVSAFGSVAVSLHGMGDAFKAANEGDPEKLAEAMAKLSMEGRRFVAEYQRVKPTLDFFADDMQDAFFAQLRGDMETLVTRYLPTMLNQLPKLSAEMGKMAHQEVGLLTSPHIMAKVNTQIALATELTSDWARMLRAGTELFFDLADAGTNFNRGFVKGLADGTEALRDWVRQQIAAGRFNQMLENGALILAKIGELAEVAGELLFDMMADPALARATATFLDTAGLALKVLHAFLDAFQVLPGPMQSVIASVFAVGGAAMLLYSRLQLLRGATLAAIQHLGQMGPAGISAANGLQATTRWAGRAAIAFTGLQVASAFVLAGAKELDPQIDALTKRLQEFAITGHLSGEAVRVLGQDMKDLDVGLKFLADTDNSRRQTARRLQESLEAIPLLGDALAKLNPTSLAHTRERVQALDQALADMVRNGHGDQALAVFERLAAVQGQYGVSTKELLALLPQYAAATDVAGGSTVELARSHKMAAMNAAILSHGLRGAVKEAGSLRAAFDALRGTTLAWVDAEIAAEDAVDRLSESLKENGKTMDVTTEKGRENKKNLKEGVEAAIDAAQAKYDDTVATKGEAVALQEANGVYRHYISQLREAMIAAGMKKQVVDELLAKFAAMPPLIATTVTTPGLDAAIARAQRLLELTNQLGSKHAAVQFTSGQYISGRRWGGITYHAQSGMLRDAGIYSPRNPARYAFAEPGTGGEAFVPKNGDYGRSMSILSEAAGWYGASVVRGGGVAMAAPSPTTIIVKLIDPMTGKVMRQAAIADATSRGVAPSAIRAAHP